MDDKVADFLGEAGVVDIVCVIPIDGISQKELIERIRITGKTARKRLEEGQKLDLWDRVEAHQSEKALYTYLLTERGQHVQIALIYHQLPALFAEFRQKESEFDRRTELVIERIRNQGLEQLLEEYDDDFTTGENP